MIWINQEWHAALWVCRKTFIYTDFPTPDHWHRLLLSMTFSIIRKLQEFFSAIHTSNESNFKCTFLFEPWALRHFNSRPMLFWVHYLRRQYLIRCICCTIWKIEMSLFTHMTGHQQNVDWCLFWEWVTGSRMWGGHMWSLSLKRCQMKSKSSTNGTGTFSVDVWLLLAQTLSGCTWC